MTYQGSPSLLDHIWSSLNIGSKTFIFDTPLADHLPALTVFDTDLKHPIISSHFRDFSFANKTKFEMNFTEEFHNFRLKYIRITDVYLKAIEITNWLTYLNNKYFPIKTKQISQKRITMPWLDDQIMTLINKKHHLFRLAKNDEIEFSSFSEYCKKLKHLLKVVENKYHRKYFNANRFNPKKK